MPIFLPSVAFFFVGLHAGRWLGRSSQPDLGDLGLTDAQRKQVEGAIQNPTALDLWGLVLITVLGPFFIVISVAFKSSDLIPIGAFLAYLVITAIPMVSAQRQRKRLMQQAIAQARTSVT